MTETFPEYVRADESRMIGTVVSVRPGEGSFEVEWEDGRFSRESLSGAGSDWLPLLSRKTAEACLAVVQQYIDRTEGEGWEPKLYPPGHEGPFWVVSLECQSDWAIDIGSAEGITWPDGVFPEAVASWCLGLHVA
jgi:hypothetical protein